ncbi:MAG TPA: MBL fold metallo-hydrolase [Sphingomicrobium sp.]|nr:MBL fold metallo-hydrolase [Sphingomicrobium sp.]
MRCVVASLVFFIASAAACEPYHLIAGRVPLDWQGPDGNTVILDGKRSLIVVDTGRSPAHAQAILDYAAQRHRPIAAIINTHWHLDHTTGNYDIRQVYPAAAVYASSAIEGALVGFLNKRRSAEDKRLADPTASQGEKAQLLRGRHRVDHPDTLRPTLPVRRSAWVMIAGRRLEVRLAKFAATEGDVWIYDPKTRTAIVGDLVVGLVPFMDTACPNGWSNALKAIAAVPFATLIPGHGEPMGRADFLVWRTAFDAFISCGLSTEPKQTCINGWERNAAKFIDGAHRTYVRSAAAYYIETRLRSSPEEQQRYCRPL